MQVGFIPAKGTTDVMFIMRQVQTRNKKLYFAFNDLEKSFDRVVRWALRKLVWMNGSSEQLWHCIQRFSSRVSTAVMDVVSSEAKSGLPSELLYDDDFNTYDTNN